MSTETINPSGTWTSTGGTHSAFSGASGTWTSTAATTGYSTASSFSSKAQTWTSYVINIAFSSSSIVSGSNDLGDTFTSSELIIEYSTDSGGGWTTLTSATDIDGASLTLSPASVASSGTINADLNTGTFQVRIQGNRGNKIGSFGSVGTSTVVITNVEIVGTYTATPTITSLNSGSPCNIGSAYNIVGTNFTGATAVSIAGVNCPTYTVTNSTTISVTIPGMGSWPAGTGTVSVTTSAGSGSANVAYIATPTVADITPYETISYGYAITAGANRTYSTTIANINPTTQHWYAGAGSIGQTTGVWTAPTPPLADGYQYSISVWPEANNGAGLPIKSLNVAVYYAPTIASFSAQITPVTVGDTAYVSASFSYGAGLVGNYSRIGTAAGGSQLGNNITSTTLYSTGALGARGTYTYYLTVVNPATTTATSTCTVQVAGAVSISAFYANSGFITLGGSDSLYSSYTNQDPKLTTPYGAYIGTTSGASGTATNVSSGSNTSVSPTTSTNYYLTLQNIATGASSTTTSSAVLVSVYSVPVATSLTASTTSPLYGATITVTPVFSAGVVIGSGTNYAATTYVGTTGNQSSDVSASPSSGTPITTAAITSAKTFTLSRGNYAGTWAYVNSALVTPQTVVVGAISTTVSRVQRLHTISMSATITGASNTNVNWTSTAGSFNPTSTASGGTTVWTAPTLKGNYTMTATSAGDATKTATKVIEVVTGSGKKATGSS